MNVGFFKGKVMKNDRRKKLLNQKAKSIVKKAERVKQICVYMDSSFIGKSFGSGPLLLDGVELGYFGRRSKSPNAKKKWYCSVKFEHTQSHLNFHGDSYRF